MRSGDTCYVILAEYNFPRSAKIINIDGMWVDVDLPTGLKKLPRCYVFSSFTAAVKAMI